MPLPDPDAGAAARPNGRAAANRLARRRILVWLNVVLWGVLAATAVSWVAGALRERAETTRVLDRFDPPVWAGQNVPGACSGGFYARRDRTIVLTIVAHCAKPGDELREVDRFIGVFGPMAQLADCPAAANLLPNRGEQRRHRPEAEADRPRLQCLRACDADH